MANVQVAIVRKKGVADVTKRGVADVTKNGVANVRMAYMYQHPSEVSFRSVFGPSEPDYLYPTP